MDNNYGVGIMIARKHLFHKIDVSNLINGLVMFLNLFINMLM